MAVVIDKKASELTAPVSIDDTDVFAGYRPGTGGEPNLDIRASVGLIRTIAANVFATGSIARLISAILADLPLSAKNFGAVGDGTTDDTVALQLWLDRVLATRRKGYLPRGKYKTTASLTVAITDATRWAGAITIEGESPGFSQNGVDYGSVIAPTSAVTGAAIDISGIANSDNSNKGQINGLLVQNIGFLGANVGTAIKLTYFTNCTFRNVHICNFATGFKIVRQANGATYGYGLNLIFDACFTVMCSSYGIDMADAGAILAAINFHNATQCGIGIKAAGGPLNVIGGYIGGCTTNGIWLTKPTDSGSRIAQVHIAGVLLESNGGAATGTYATDDCQILIDASTSVLLAGNEFLGSTTGVHSVKSGFGADACVGLVAIGNRHWGKTSVANQRAFLLGDQSVRAVPKDHEIDGMAGVSAGTRTPMASAIRGQTYGGGYGLGPGCIVDGAISITGSGGTGNLFTVNDMPPGATCRVAVRSQGGAVWATGFVTRSRTGSTITVTQTAASADCAMALSGTSVRITNNNASTTTFYWIMTLEDAV